MQTKIFTPSRSSASVAKRNVQTQAATKDPLLLRVARGEGKIAGTREIYDPPSLSTFRPDFFAPSGIRKNNVHIIELISMRKSAYSSFRSRENPCLADEASRSLYGCLPGVQ